MNEIIGLLADSIITPRSLWYDVIYDDLGQVQIRVDESNLF